MVAKYYGQKDDAATKETVHTAVLTSLVSGAFLAVFGILVSRPLLALMDTPEDVIDGAVTYMRIYFLGMPVIMLYNFTSAILRAVGDTRRPLYYLLIAGVINVMLNLFFVIVLRIGVAGVAIATVASQVISATLVLKALLTYEGCLKLDPKALKINVGILLKMLQIGLPAGLQGTLFSVSNVLIQSSINSFGSAAMSGNAAAVNLEGFVYVGMNSFHHTALSFTSQNYGAGEYKRIKKVLIYALMFTSFAGMLFGFSAYFFRYPLLRIYIGNEPNIDEIIGYGAIRMTVIMTTYFLCGVMDVLVGSLRGLGHSVLPMFMTLGFVCGLRIIWIFTVFQMYRDLAVLYVSYPISWGAAAVAHTISYIIIYHGIKKKYKF